MSLPFKKHPREGCQIQTNGFPVSPLAIACTRRLAAMYRSMFCVLMIVHCAVDVKLSWASKDGSTKALREAGRRQWAGLLRSGNPMPMASLENAECRPLQPELWPYEHVILCELLNRLDLNLPAKTDPEDLNITTPGPTFDPKAAQTPKPTQENPPGAPTAISDRSRRPSGRPRCSWAGLTLC